MEGSRRVRRGAALGAATLAAYRRSWLRADVLAGITVTAYLVPQCLAYSELAGLVPVTGLWVAVVAMVAYALLGTSRILSVGPESATAVMVAAAVAPLAGGDPGRYATLAAGLAVFVGVVCIAGFALRLGFIADLLSHPILVGYMAGVALIMISSQLGTVTGVALATDAPVDRLAEVVRRLSEIRPAPMLVGAGVVALLLVFRRLAPLAPGSLVAVVAAVAVVAVLGLEREGVALVGAIPVGLPSPALPAIGPHEVAALAGPAVAIAFVAYSDVALTARAFTRRNGETIDANREFLALGTANVAAGLTGGFVTSASASRTAIVDVMRAHSQASGLVAAASVVIVVLLLPDAISLIPKAALAGIVFVAATRLIDVDAMRRLGRFRPTELGLALAAMGGVLLFDVLAGILVAIALSVIDLFARVARPPASVLGRVPGLAGLHNIDDYPDARTLPGLVVFRYDAPLCFANAADFRERALAAVDAETEPVEWFLLNAEAIVELDLTAVDAVRELHGDLAARGIVFALARVKQDLRAQLARGGLLDEVGPDRMFPTLPVALEAFDARRGSRGVSPEAPPFREQGVDDQVALMQEFERRSG